LLDRRLIIYRKVSRRGFVGKASSEPLENAKLSKDQSKAEQIPISHIVDKGEKQESSILSVKIKNSEELKNNTEALKAIDSALWKAKESGAKIYSEGDYRIIVLAPVLTKEKVNTIKALITTQTIERMLNAYNKRHDPKIQFGIGAHIGNLIVENKDKKFRFISVNNTISATKRISQHSDNDVLLSESMHRQTIGKVKTQKSPHQNYWKLLKVVDRSQHAAYINKFSEQQKRDADEAAKKKRFKPLPRK